MLHDTILRPARHPLKRVMWLGVGGVLIVASPIVGVIPGPGGVFVLAAGLGIILQNSKRAKRYYVKVKRTRPKLGRFTDWGLRRASAKRRSDLAKQDTNGD